MAIKLAQIIDEEKKTCAVAMNDNNPEYYKRMGFKEMDVEHCEWDGNWYLTGYMPAKPEPTIEEQVYALKMQLNDVDNKSNRSMRAIIAGPASEEDRTFLNNLEAQAEDLRRQIRELENSL